MVEAACMKKSPPRCPSCKTRLVEVFENEYNTYVFDPTSGAYKMHETKGDIDIRCPNCDIKLFDVFPEGVCNCVSKKRTRA
jgi:DNA-directed RNA polymerase subunit RPC12/RpoP